MKLYMITLSVILNTYVLAMINYGIRSSVRKCEANKYPKCSETLLKACITIDTSIDNTKWHHRKQTLTIKILLMKSDKVVELLTKSKSSETVKTSAKAR